MTRHARPHGEPGLEPEASFYRWLGPSCGADPQHPLGPHWLPRECSPESGLAQEALRPWAPPAPARPVSLPTPPHTGHSPDGSARPSRTLGFLFSESRED